MVSDKHTEDTEEIRCSPLMTWEEEEAGKIGQMNLPEFTEMPTMAERIFLRLAREWRSSVRSTQNRTKEQGSHEETLLLACLMLAVRWGRAFTPLPMKEIALNRYTYKPGGSSYEWLDQLAWDLCEYALSNEHDRQSQHRTIESLVANLSHGTSSIRIWIVDLAWLFLPEIPLIYNRAAVNELLKNLTSALVYWDSSAALASRFFATPGDFFDYASRVAPPSAWEEQYTERLRSLRTGLTVLDNLFSRLEKDCWDVIVPAFMDKKFVPLQRDSIF